jgi:hypothetical protein
MESIAATAPTQDRSDGGSEPSQVSHSLDQLLRAVERSSITARDDQTRVRRASAPIQARLSVGSADDPHEREADEVAGQVVESVTTARTQRPSGHRPPMRSTMWMTRTPPPGSIAPEWAGSSWSTSVSNPKSQPAPAVRCVARCVGRWNLPSVQTSRRFGSTKVRQLGA